VLSRLGVWKYFNHCGSIEGEIKCTFSLPNLGDNVLRKVNESMEMSTDYQFEVICHLDQWASKYASFLSIPHSRSFRVFQSQKIVGYIDRIGADEWSVQLVDSDVTTCMRLLVPLCTIKSDRINVFRADDTQMVWKAPHFRLMGKKFTLESTDVPALSAILKFTTAVDLSGNAIRDEGVANLSSALKNCTNLQTLDLSGNHIGAEGVSILSSVLMNFTNLQTLNISGNNIGDEGVANLSSALKNCTNLQTLNLSGNAIRDEGVANLLSALMNSTNLHTLNLTDNHIGAEGVLCSQGPISHLLSKTALIYRP
jgi:hypothetical protein